MDEDSLADRLGIRPGDQILAVNDHVLRDVIDYHFYAADERLEIEIERAGTRLVLNAERGYGDDFGIGFAEDVFDGIRRCVNRCQFCFVDQMPPGLRSSLYVKDDDYRYSFLYGNFITLSNWSEQDWERVNEQHLSPLYVSVHTTDPELRRRMMCNPRLPDIHEQLLRLTGMGIEVHAQIVVVPGANDGPYLDHTVEDLTALFPGVQSIGVVPVGLTKYHRGDVRLLTDEEVHAVLDQLVPRQQENRRRLGVDLVYPSDELYLRAGYPIPTADEYDGFPQLENGIGLVRELLDGWENLKRRGAGGAGGRGTLVCGTLIASVMSKIVEEVSERLGVEITVRPVETRFFGSSVTVSGLLTGRDVVHDLEGQELGEVVFLPRAMFDAAGRVTLDDATATDIEGSLAVPVIKASDVQGILDYFSRPELGGG